MSDNKKIFLQIQKIMDEIAAIGKTHKNQQQGFSFRGIDDFYNMLHPLFAKHGVFCVPEIQEITREERTSKNGGAMTSTVVQMKYTFYADDGSSFWAKTAGEAVDSGDKSVTKAMAIAHKYALMQTFVIPTQEEKDPDFQAHELAPRAAPIKPVIQEKQLTGRDAVGADIMRLRVELKMSNEDVLQWAKNMTGKETLKALSDKQIEELRDQMQAEAHGPK